MKNLLVWLSDPANVALLGTVLGMLLSLAANLAQKLGALRAAGVIGELKADVAEGTATTVALVQGVQKIKQTLPGVDALEVNRILQEHTEAAGVQHVVKPIVDAVKVGLPAEVVVKRATDRFDAANVAARADVTDRVQAPAAGETTNPPGATP